jgi:hypothetical protein
MAFHSSGTLCKVCHDVVTLGGGERRVEKKAVPQHRRRDGLLAAATVRRREGRPALVEC